ncbi:hypothetical protein M378DRAFT_648341 [Amanita muscaria Koide BX008]|uniref:Uncharacterized protein n=1 Tax=Amanita muscaria (strain Koide BX008) TaxID=946122 RepID=A0A0C2TB53_AMAMK|nr:hypothetical protein M378DRAFT_648341 [Amanita muscaria Koide BX008]
MRKICVTVLPSSPTDNPRWNRIPGHGPGEGFPGILLKFSVPSHEHDLIINVISFDIGNQADRGYGMVLSRPGPSQVFNGRVSSTRSSSRHPRSMIYHMYFAASGTTLSFTNPRHEHFSPRCKLASARPEEVIEGTFTTLMGFGSVFKVQPAVEGTIDLLNFFYCREQADRFSYSSEFPHLFGPLVRMSFK